MCGGCSSAKGLPSAPAADVLSLDLPRSAAALDPWQYVGCLLRDDPYLVAQAQRT
jgi:hypothetical protein